jgi:hypothetical protein
MLDREDFDGRSIEKIDQRVTAIAEWDQKLSPIASQLSDRSTRLGKGRQAQNRTVNFVDSSPRGSRRIWQQETIQPFNVSPAAPRPDDLDELAAQV